MPSIRVSLLLLAAVAIAGCINSTTVIKVNPDGSGTIEQTTLVNVAALKSVMPQAGNPVNEAELKRTAERMGKGVRLVSAEPVKANGFEGSKAVFAFDDINQVQVTQDPGVGGGNGSGPGAKRQSDDPVKFALVRTAGTSVLTVTVQDMPAATSTTTPGSGGLPDLSDPMMMGMLKSMFQGFKVNIALEAVGTIVKTNAEYVNGSRMTLLDLNLSALLEDEAQFKMIQSKLGPGASLATVKPYLKDMKGIKIDGPVITVEFK